jgi:hypothetical protein
MEKHGQRRALNTLNKGDEEVTAAIAATTSSSGGSEPESADTGGGRTETNSTGEGGTDGTTKDNPSDKGPAPKKAWSKFTKDMLGNKTDFLDEMLRDFDVVDHGNGSLTFNGVLYTIPPEMYTNSTGEAVVLPEGNTSDANYTVDSVE